MVTEYYLPLKNPASNRKELLAFAKSYTRWARKNAFDVALVPDSMIADNHLMELIKKFHAVPVIFRVPPWQFYRFHTDARRSCAINLLLEGDDSNTFYGTETADEEVLDIVELKYDLDCYYLLNTHLKHAVINKNNTRYMFSMGFPDTLSYQDIKTYCLENNL